MSQHTWYIAFWIGMWAVSVFPVCVLLYLIWQKP